MARRRNSAFTLVELLTVAFIIAIMVGLLLPALQSINKTAMNARTKQILETLREGITGYMTDFPGQFPPSEPDVVGTSCYGGAALLYYLNGWDGTSGLSTNATEGGTVGGGANFSKTYPARVQGVRVRSGAGFLDAWGYVIEYFVAYKGRSPWLSGWPRPVAGFSGGPGSTCADVYPRACNVSLVDGVSDYSFNDSSGRIAISGLNLRVSAAKWLDGRTNPDPVTGSYPSDWKFHMVPVNMGAYILVSMGADGLWGTSDDQGDVATWGN